MYRIASYDSHTKPERQQRYARRRRCYGLHATDAGFREFSHVQLGKQPSLEVAPTTLATFFSYERKLELHLAGAKINDHHKLQKSVGSKVKFIVRTHRQTNTTDRLLHLDHDDNDDGNDKLAATLRWFTAGGAIRIALGQLLQNRK